MTTKIKTGIKLKVNPEQSLYVQNICFANGIYWVDRTQDLFFPHYPIYYINISKYGHMSYTTIDDDEDFKNEYEEVDTMWFLITNGTCDIIKYPANVKFRIPDDLPKEIKKRFVDEFAGQTTEDGTGWSTFCSWDGFHNSPKKEVSFYEVFPQYRLENLEQEIKNKEDEESEMVTEEKVYKNAKEYLVDICVYEKVIHNCLNVEPAVDDLDDMLTFSSLFTWDETVEGDRFWREIDTEIEDLELFMLIDEILEDVASAKASESTIPTLKPEDIPFLMEGLEPPKEEPEQPKQYLVYVEGKQAPKKVHNSLKSAQKEANRLAKREVGYVTYVVGIVNKYIATVSVEEIK